MVNLPEVNDLNNNLETPSPPFSQQPDLAAVDKSIATRFEERQERWMNKLGKYSWMTNLYQLLIGLSVAYLSVWWSKPYLEGWVIGIASFLFISGAFYGWFITRRIEIRLTETRAAIFSYSGLMKQFVPMLLILFILRWTLRYLDHQDIANVVPMMRTLTFFIAGVFLARAITILVMIYKIYRNNPLEIV